MVKKNPLMSTQKIAEHSWISTITKNKEAILIRSSDLAIFVLWMVPTCCITKYLSRWFTTLWKCNAIEHLRFSDFKASKDGQWKNIHSVKIMKIYGKSDLWKERLPNLVQGYSKENIWNLYKTDCVWRALPYHHSFFFYHSAKEVRT